MRSFVAGIHQVDAPADDHGEGFLAELETRVIFSFEKQPGGAASQVR
jgi:hypothetical protein